MIISLVGKPVKAKRRGRVSCVPLKQRLSAARKIRDYALSRDLKLSQIPPVASAMACSYIGSVAIVEQYRIENDDVAWRAVAEAEAR